MIRRLTALALALFLPVLAQAAPIAVHPEIEAFQKDAETSVTEKLRVYLGGDIRFAVHVLARPEKPTEPGAGAATHDDGYVEVPFSLESGEEEDSAAGKDGFALDGLDVTLLLPEGLSEKTTQGAKNLVEQILRAYRPTVTLGTIPAKEQPPVSSAELLQPLLFPITAVVVAIIFLLGFLIMAMGISKGARSISDGIRVIFGNRLIGGEQPAADKPKEPPKEEEEKSLTEAPEYLRFKMREIPRNLKLIQEALRENPVLVGQCLGTNAFDWRGVRWLLSRLDPSEQEQLIRFLDPERKKAVQTATGGLAPDETSSWLQSLVERLVLTKFQARNDIRIALGPELVEKICKTTPQQLILAARAVNTPACWRLLTELVPSDQLSEVIGSLPPDQWVAMANFSNLSAAEFSESANQLLSYIELQLQEPEDVVSRKEFLSTKLLDSVVKIIKTQKPGEDDRIIAELAQQAPDFAEMIGTRLWTVRMLDRVPDAPILQLFREIDYEKRVALVSTLPEPKSQRVLALLPEGNMRTIVLDMVAAFRKRNNPEEAQKANQIVHEFMSELQRRSESGQFQLAAISPGEPARAA